MDILLIEDNPGDTRLVQEMLREAGRDSSVYAVGKLKSGLEFLAAHNVEVVLLDLGLPDSSGLETFITLQGRFPLLPVVIMTSLDDEDFAVRAVQAGAEDYLVKGRSDGSSLRRALLYAVERKRMKMALKKSEEQHRRIIETALDGFWIVDLKGRFLDINDSYCQMTGYARKEMLTMSIPDVEAAEKPEETAEHIKKVVAKGSDRFETRHRRKDGKIIELEVSAKYSDFEGGQIVVFIRDITERKQVEKLKEEFISLVSHEMRTPLTVIIGALNTIISSHGRILPQEARRLLEDAYVESEELAHILENLLELSRAKANRLVLASQEVDIKAIVEGVAGELERRTSRLFTLDIPEHLPSVKADPLRVKRILYNLMHNAAKYSPSGTEIRVLARIEDNHIMVGVQDHGVGISSADQAKLFNPFQRLESGKALNAKGTGVGLTVCRRLVEAHGGRIWIESEPDQGATFLFTLPLYPVAQQIETKIDN